MPPARGRARTGRRRAPCIPPAPDPSLRPRGLSPSTGQQVGSRAGARRMGIRNLLRPGYPASAGGRAWSALIARSAACLLGTRPSCEPGPGPGRDATLRVTIRVAARRAKAALPSGTARHRGGQRLGQWQNRGGDPQARSGRRIPSSVGAWKVTDRALLVTWSAAFGRQRRALHLRRHGVDRAMQRRPRAVACVLPAGRRCAKDPRLLAQ